jgi:hypothetical protein
MNIDLESMSISLPAVVSHPNRLPFRGVLTLVDAASDRAPAGARGHRVLLTRQAAEAALPSLLGMGLDYTPSLDGHDARRKIGIITAADIVTRPAAGSRQPAAIEVSGYLFAKDFPDIVRELRAQNAGTKRALGMSYEIADARVADVSASVWSLTDVTFTGAAILLRDKAAYSNTWIELQQSANSNQRSAKTDNWQPATDNSGVNMKPEIEQQLITTSERLAQAAETLSATLSRLDAQNDELAAKVERIIAAIETDTGEDADARKALEDRIAELERANTDLKAQAERRASIAAARKTLPPLVTALLAKSGVEPEERLDPATLDKTLASLSVEQRIAVKGQMARAGLID